MSSFIEALSTYTFLQHAVIAALLASIACGIIGTYVVTRRIVFISGGISHASFGGIGLGFYLGINPILGALGVALASAFGIGLLTTRARQREDTVIGMLWASGFAIGILFAYATPGYVPDFASYLFGNILFVSADELLLMAALDIVIVVAVALLYKELLAISFDDEFARVAGLRADALYLLLLSLIALAVVVLIKIVGIVLIIALLTIPVAIAGFFTRTLQRMMVLSTVLEAAILLAGLWLSWVFDIQPGATIVLLAGALFIVAMAYTTLGKSPGQETSQ